MSPVINTPSKTVPRTGFRADLQGLRALAVLLVMCYHIWFSRVSGGVDIFLMLSAFFLTSATAKRISRGEKPKVISGWAHRFSRLVPQAAVVVIAVVIAAWTLLPGTRWLELIDQAFASLLYRQNWYLADHQVNYYAFNTDSASPLQHFWSLSVQGQIFILWPLILGLCALLWKAFFSRHSFALVAGTAFALVFAGSLAYSIHLTATNQQVAYFHTGARLWEFALGSLLALALPWLQKLPASARRVTGWLGLATIVGCGALLDVQGQFPGYLALVPTLGAALIIMAPSERRWANPAGLLSLPVLTKLGDLSYGMYLWHWPLLVFFLQVSGSAHAGVVSGTLLILVSIVLSWATTTWVEKPLAAWQSSTHLGLGVGAPHVKLASGLLVMALGIGVACLPVLALEGNVEYRRIEAAAQPAQENPGAQATEDWDPSPAALTLPLATDLDSEWQTPGEGCSGSNSPDDERIIFCQQGGDVQDGTAPTLVMLGDSHMQHWSDAAAQMTEQAGGSWVLIYHPGCRYGSTAALKDPACADFQEAAREYVAALAPATVLTTASTTVATVDELGRTPGEQEAMVDGYAAAIEPFLESGSQVIALRDTPRYTYKIPECVDKGTTDASDCDGEASYLLAASNPVDAFLAEHNYGSSVISLDLTEILCPAGACKAVIGNVLTYLDDSHLSKTFVVSAADQFAASFAQATKGK